MTYILTLVADRDATTLSPAVISRVRIAVGGGEPVILSPGEACDILCLTPPEPAVIEAALEHLPIDHIVTRNRGRIRRCNAGYRKFESAHLTQEVMVGIKITLRHH